MPRRNIVPLALLAALAVLTVVFAALAASSSPDSSSLVVQNATGETFGYPDGASSFSMHLTASASSNFGSPGTPITQVRLVHFVGPDRMAVYQVGAQPKPVAVLDQPAIDCALRAYTAMVGGATPWAGNGSATSSGSTFRRTEGLGAFAARVPQAAGTVCAPQSTVVRGTVSEVATVRSGYLVTLRLTIVVPPQTFNGGTVAAGIEGETLQLLQINGTPVGSLGS
jgi:hypothetical protein